MSEDRFPGDLPEARASSVKVALGVTGVVVGVAVLLCGGVAGYVALTTTEAVTEPPPPPSPRENADQVMAFARRMISIDFPPGFEPISGEPSQMMHRARFGRRDEEGAYVKLGRVDLSSIPAGTGSTQVARMMTQMLEMGDDRSATIVRRDPSTATTREFTVLGKPVTFNFVDGTVPPSGPPVKVVSGVFRTQNAYIGLVYVIPSADYDEEQLLRMIESIRPAAGDSAPDADTAETPAENASKQTEKGAPTNAPAEEEKPDDELNPGPDDAQGSSR